MGSGQKFVPNGVMLRCSSGTAPGTLRVIPKPVKLSGQIFATEMDTIPFVNIPMFGGCRNKPYCAPCTPIPTGWQNVCSDGVKVFGARPLLANSSNSCGLGGRITISNVMSAGGGGAFSSMFASVMATGMPDVSALTGAGSSSVPVNANPMSAVANVGGVAALAGGSLPPVQALTALPTNLSNLPSVTNVAAAAQNSGLANAMGKVAAGMEKVKDKLDQFMGKAQGFIDKGQQFLGKATDFAGKLNQYGGMATKLLGSDKLQKALQKWTDKLQNVQSQVSKVVSKFNTYKDAALKGMTYLTKASTFLSNFSKKLGSGALAAKWNAFKSQLGQRAKTFFSQIKQGVDKLKNQKYPDTIGGWLKRAQSGFSDLSGASQELSKGLKDAKSYLAGASEGIKTFGGVVSTLTGNPAAKAAMEKWAAELDKVGNKVGDTASKAEKAAEILKKGANFSKKAAAFFEKDKKSGGLKEKWDEWSQKMGGQAGAFFDSMKSNIRNLKNMKTPDSVSGWLAMGGTGLSDLSGLFGKTNEGIKDFKNIISNSAGQIRSIGGIVSSVTGNKWLEQWADKWDHAGNQVNQVAAQVADYQDKLKTGGEWLKTGSEYAQKAADFIKKFKSQLPSGSPFQNWGSSISNWVTALKNQSFELPKMGSVKELLGDLEKLSGNLGVGLDKVSDILGKGDSGLTSLAGMVGLFNKDTAAKLKKWAAKLAEFKEKAKKAAETARKVKEQLSKVTEKIADFKAKWKKGVEKAKAFWAKMKAKFPKFNKGLDLSRLPLPIVPPIPKLALPTVQSVQVAQVAALSPVPIPPVALPPNVAVANSAAPPAAGAVKGGSVKVSVSVSGSGVVNGTSRVGTVTVTKPNIQLPDMSDKNAPKAKPAAKPPVKPKVPVNPVVKPPVKPKVPVKTPAKPKPPTPCELMAQSAGNEPNGYATRLASIEAMKKGLKDLPSDKQAEVSKTIEEYQRLNKATERAKLSDAVYEDKKFPPLDKMAPDWKLVSKEELKKLGISQEMLQDDASGFKARIYCSDIEPGKYVISYAGTEDIKKDGGADLIQGIGLQSQQYDKAMILARTLKLKVGINNVETTGHSLGGGLASAASQQTGFKGMTFNPAGLHQNTVTREGASIKDYEMGKNNVEVYKNSRDPLNLAQDNRKLVGMGLEQATRRLPYVGMPVSLLVKYIMLTGGIPKAYGKNQYKIETNDSLLDGHKMGKLVTAIQAKRDALLLKLKKDFGCKLPIYA